MCESGSGLDLSLNEILRPWKFSIGYDPDRVRFSLPQSILACHFHRLLIADRHVRRAALVTIASMLYAETRALAWWPGYGNSILWIDRSAVGKVTRSWPLHCNTRPKPIPACRSTRDSQLRLSQSLCSGRLPPSRQMKCAAQLYPMPVGDPLSCPIESTPGHASQFKKSALSTSPHAKSEIP